MEEPSAFFGDDASRYEGKSSDELLDKVSELSQKISKLERNIATNGIPDKIPSIFYQLRRIRDGIFPDIFSDPAWDILLDLYEYRRKGRLVSVTSACLAASVPPTTALRYIARLVDEGLISRQTSPHDRRVVYLDFTNHGMHKMHQFITSSMQIIINWSNDRDYLL